MFLIPAEPIGDILLQGVQDYLGIHLQEVPEEHQTKPQEWKLKNLLWENFLILVKPMAGENINHSQLISAVVCRIATILNK